MTDGGENGQLDDAAYRGSRRRLRHSISAVGSEILSTKKRPLGPSVRGQDVGAMLIAESLARLYECGRTSCPARASWCAMNPMTQ